MFWVAHGVAIILLPTAAFFAGIVIGQRPQRMRQELQRAIDREANTWWAEWHGGEQSQVAKGPGGSESLMEQSSRDQHEKRS